ARNAAAANHASVERKMATMAEVLPIQRSHKAAAALCALMIALFTTLAWSASKQKSSTCDEPLHAAAGWAHWRYADFRVDPEDPPLFEYWAMLAHRRDSLKVDLN